MSNSIKTNKEEITTDSLEDLKDSFAKNPSKAFNDMINEYQTPVTKVPILLTVSHLLSIIKDDSYISIFDENDIEIVPPVKAKNITKDFLINKAEITSLEYDPNNDVLTIGIQTKTPDNIAEKLSDIRSLIYAFDHDNSEDLIKLMDKYNYYIPYNKNSQSVYTIEGVLLFSLKILRGEVSKS